MLSNGGRLAWRWWRWKSELVRPEESGQTGPSTQEESGTDRRLSVRLCTRACAIHYRICIFGDTSRKAPVNLTNQSLLHDCCRLSYLWVTAPPLDITKACLSRSHVQGSTNNNRASRQGDQASTSLSAVVKSPTGSLSVFHVYIGVFSKKSGFGSVSPRAFLVTLRPVVTTSSLVSQSSVAGLCRGVCDDRHSCGNCVS